VAVRLTICGLLTLGAAVSITGGLLTQRTPVGHVLFAIVHGVVIVIALALAAGALAERRNPQLKRR
jgi:hypothetical protein